MKKYGILLLVFASFGHNLFAQNYSVYSNESLIINSKNLKESIELNIHFPETHAHAAENTRYPIMIVFDSQHDRTYPQIISAFDLLSSETQIPECILVGVPFNIHNRKYYTSEQKKEGEHISGIEKMEAMIFEELIPKLRANLHGGDFIGLIGHSRTAFLVNYLTFKRPKEVNLTIAASGFFDDEPLNAAVFHNLLSNPKSFENDFYYFATAGNSLEDENYLMENRVLDSLIRLKGVAENVHVSILENDHANHMTNYWLSIPPILIDVFSAYNDLLNNWFHDKLKTEQSEIGPDEFEADLKTISEKFGVNLNPNLTHIYSLASHFGNFLGDYERGIAFFELGLKYFPDFLEFYVEIIEYCKLAKNKEKEVIYKNLLREKARQSATLSESEKQEIMDYLNE